MASFEVEIKSHLGDERKAIALRKRMVELDPKLKLLSRNKQLNHYFVGGDLAKLAEALGSHVSKKTKKQIDTLVKKTSSFSVRTRQKDKEVFIVIKASVGNDTSSNGVARIEIEEKVDLTLSKLDKLVLSAGFEYQAKWSREREEYKYKDITVTLDRNAGYGWLAEFEKVINQKSKLEETKEKIYTFMKECKVKELEQEKLERMFAFYNKNWEKYYGTNKIFTIA
jgi:predicted adenylyl cyclase CyaB